MSRVKLAMHKGPGLAAWLIKWWTRSDFSHGELVIDGIAYSSSARDGGVRSKTIDFNSNNWVLIDLPWADADKLKIEFEKLIALKLKYGYWDLFLHQVINSPIDNSTTSDFCTECIARVLGFQYPEQYSPNMLFTTCLYLNSIYEKGMSKNG